MIKKNLTPSSASPRNKYRASITYDKALSKIGSVVSVGAMTISALKSKAKIYTNQAKQKKVGSHVHIFENKLKYPKFNWILKKTYYIKV